MTGGVPGYWMWETGGELAPAMRRFIGCDNLHPGDLALIRAYLEQWIDAPVWNGGFAPAADTAALAALRRDARLIATEADIHRWLARAGDLGIDPL